LAECDDGSSRQAFKALFPGDKEEKKKVYLFSFLISIMRKQKKWKQIIDAISGSGLRRKNKFCKKMWIPIRCP
jgi:hypothetical protein